MKRIGIYGGSFNPPHYGHLVVCESARVQLGLDKVIFIPSAVPPHKRDVRLAPAEARIEMTKLATADNPFFEVSSMEIIRGGTSYTVDTLQELRKANPDSRLHLLIGADNWVEFETWKSPEVIMDLADVVVLTRPGFRLERVPPRSLAAKGVRFLEVPEIGISGTMIRLEVISRRSIRYLTPPAVEQYIQQHALYHEKPPV